MFENCVKLINFGRDLSIDIDFNELLRSLNTNLNIQHSPNDPSNGLYPMHTVASMGYHSNTSIYIKTDTIRIGDYFTTIFSDKKCDLDPKLIKAYIQMNPQCQEIADLFSIEWKQIEKNNLSNVVFLSGLICNKYWITINNFKSELYFGPGLAIQLYTLNNLVINGTNHLNFYYYLKSLENIPNEIQINFSNMLGVIEKQLLETL